MKRLIMSLFVALCCFFSASAVPAYPGLITYTQPDGSVIKIRLHGDEFCHWVTNEAGQVVEQDEDGFYRVVDSSKLAMRRSAGRASRAEANEARRGPAKAAVASGKDKHFLVILVQFDDVKFSTGNNQAAFYNLMNKQGYSDNGGTGSARDYYSQNSGGSFEPNFDVYGPVTLSHDQAYYGGNTSGQGTDQRPREAVKEACELLNPDIDFSQYDLDNDGYVDLVFMYYAGRGEADGGGANCIWPHQWSVSGLSNNAPMDGVRISKYACTNELTKRKDNSIVLCGIGTACHEFGHAMGLPDMYDTDYETNGEAGALYHFSMMASGSYNNEGRTPPYFNIEERIILGWKTESDIKEFTSSGYYTLTSVNNNVAYKTPTTTEGEYFLYECRSQTGWDAYIPQAGLIVYHVDKSSRLVSVYNSNNVLVNETAHDLWYNWSSKYNSINENGSHPCFYVVPAGSQDNLNYSGTHFAFTGSNGNYSTFTGKSWNGVACNVRLSQITYADNQVTLYAMTPSSTLNYNVIANPESVYKAGDSFALTLEESAAQPVESVAWYFDDEPVNTSVTLTAGTHVVEAHLTLVSGEEKIVELTLNVQ